MMPSYPCLAAVIARFDPSLFVELEDYTGRWLLMGLDPKQQNALRREITDFLAMNYTPREVVEFWNRHSRMRIRGGSAAFSIHIFRNLLEKLEEDYETRCRSYAERWHPNPNMTDE